MDQNQMFGDALWVTKEKAKEDCFFLRSKFFVTGAKKATLRVLGLGFFHCYINGKRVSEDLFLPLNTEFEPREIKGQTFSGYRIYVPEYDVTDYLQEGENVIAIHFGGGWYTLEKFGETKAIWRIFGEDEKGGFDVYSSTVDKIEKSFVTQYNFAWEEAHDYRIASCDAEKKDFDDSLWTNAIPAKPLKTEYLYSDCPVDKVIEKITPIKTFQGVGYDVYDCGKNTTGYPIVKLTAKEGEQVRIVFTERLHPDGNLNEKFSHGQTLTFVCDGKQRIVKPQFTWFGFRAFAIYGSAQVQWVEVVHADVKQTSSFVSNNELLNWIHNAYVNTQLTNIHAGIPSDCPHIERRGYTGDGQLTCRAVMHLFDAKSFYKKWMQDIADGQDKNSGHVQYSAPYVRVGGGPGGWGGAIVEVPYQYYLAYGEVEILKEYYPRILKYFEYLENHSFSNLVVSDEEGAWCLGDWCSPAEMLLPPPFVNTYFYVKYLYRAIEIAKVIGKEEDIPFLQQRIDAKKQALSKAYEGDKNGNYFANRQGANAFAVDIGIGNEKTYPNLVTYYEKLGQFDTGIFGTEILIRTLFEKGNGQLAVDLLLSQGEYSFSKMKEAGSTTLWENWPGARWMRSLNHPMFGAIVQNFYDYLLGIQGNAGYQEVRICPVLVNEIHKLCGHKTLLSGKIEVAYEKKDNEVYFSIIVPQKQKATFMYNATEYPLKQGKNEFVFSL